MMPLHPLRPLADWYKRRRHTLGYGVHSPLAYYLVRNVVRDWHRYRYYAFHDIDVMTAGADDCWRRRRRARVIHRLVARLEIPEVRWSGGVDPVMKLAADAAVSRKGSGRLIVADCGAGVPGDVRSAIGDERGEAGTVYLLFGLDAGEMERLVAAVPCGVVLTGEDSLLAVVTKRVVKVRYTVVL